ncbi:MAG: hypothetical protein CMM62_09220 [Rhodospirillaceae bacterium]|nr:hypothetical protein [Rhodospirillaceae bacterium]MAX61949.1 hypothetical protein [Rhodospirillaceae bacterium]MAX63285.1 hypothetical protein [Rhodospirillaceae bacterium]|tara:strand:- start:7002 stop:7865 length:864 start_codon:yes stop_codon:yes gene_type:complete
MGLYELDVDPLCPMSALQKRFSLCLGFRIRALRICRGMAQDELSKKVGLSKYQMHRIETGENVHSTCYADIIRLACALDVAPIALVPRSTDLSHGWENETDCLLFSEPDNALRLAVYLLQSDPETMDSIEARLNCDAAPMTDDYLQPWNVTALPAPIQADLSSIKGHHKSKSVSRIDIHLILKAVRQHRRITVVDLAGRTRMNKYGLRDFEKADSTVALWRVVAIARALYINLADLFPDDAAQTKDRSASKYASPDVTKMNRAMDCVWAWSQVKNAKTRHAIIDGNL